MNMSIIHNTRYNQIEIKDSFLPKYYKLVHRINSASESKHILNNH